MDSRSRLDAAAGSPTLYLTVDLLDGAIDSSYRLHDVRTSTEPLLNGLTNSSPSRSHWHIIDGAHPGTLAEPQLL